MFKYKYYIINNIMYIISNNINRHVIKYILTI